MSDKTDVATLCDQLTLQLPYDRTKSPTTDYECAYLARGVATPLLELTDPESESTHQANPLSAELLAAWIALFYRYSNQEIIPLIVRLALGSHFVDDPFLIKQNVSGELTFDALVEDIRQTFDIRMCRESGIAEEGSDPGHESVAVTISIWERDMCPSEEEAGKQSSDSEPDLNISLWWQDTQLHAGIHYNAAVFNRETVFRIIEHYQQILSSAKKGDRLALKDLTLMRKTELQLLKQACTGRQALYPSRPLHREIEHHAERRPNDVAVQYGTTSLTYESMNQQANRLAHFLAAKHVRPGSRIVVCVEPSLDIATALLAIFKLGGTYIPLDPSYPVHRVGMIIEDTAPTLVLTHSHLSTIPAADTYSVVHLDRIASALQSQNSDNPDVEYDLTLPATIYYTSGTTGKPKGVVANHANLINTIYTAQRRYGFCADDRMPALASFSFSISLFELMSPLVAGGTLVILDRNRILDPASLANVLQQVTVVHAGPALLKGLVRHLQQHVSDYSVFQKLRHLSSGGDMVPPELLRALRGIFSQSELFVIYGCSEISCMGCTHFYPHDLPIERTHVGKPFDNVSLILVDSDDHLVPQGVVGDVCFGGKGVVPGYLNRPELEAEKFFYHQGKRFYRTGDRGRLNHQGDLELLGRLDFQIQLRGMRIELGEIDYHLRKAPGVREGLTVARQHGASEKVLAAFFVSEPNAEVETPSIRHYLAQHLPDYMVPTFFVELEALPLNHNLKVDRNALPDLGPQITTKTLLPPNTPTEKDLAEIWRELLRLESISREDNFLLLGGDSLLAMSFIIETQRRIGVTIDGMDVLRESLQVLARLCDESLGVAAQPMHRTASVRTIDPSTSFYFGGDDSLYGVFHPVEKGTDKRPVLICPPIWHEYMRCHFLLRNIATRLCRDGIPVLRFDYYGTGDSQGRDRDADLLRWQEDCIAAYGELTARSGKPPIIFGVRLGATLALNAFDSEAMDGCLLWDPVFSGECHYQEQSKKHSETIWNWLTIRNLKLPRRREGFEELLGKTYSDRLIQELKSIQISKECFMRRSSPRLCRKTPSSAREREIFSPGKGGEAGDVCSTVDAAGCGQADNGGCLDPTVAATAADKTIQEKGSLEARSSFPTQPSVLATHDTIVPEALSPHPDGDTGIKLVRLDYHCHWSRSLSFTKVISDRDIVEAAVMLLEEGNA